MHTAHEVVAAYVSVGKHRPSMQATPVHHRNAASVSNYGEINVFDKRTGRRAICEVIKTGNSNFFHEQLQNLGFTR